MFELEEALGQRLDLLAQPLDHRPLLGDLRGEFLDGPVLLCGPHLQGGQAIGRC